MYDSDNTSLSPIGVTLVILGLIALATAPPIGVVMLGFAVYSQRRFRSHVRYDREVRIAKARAKLDREKILAARSLGR